MNITFLSWFLDVVTRSFSMSRGGRLHKERNLKGYEVGEHISTKVEVNPQMLSTLKKGKYIGSMKQIETFDISVVGPLEIFVALVKIKIGQVYSNSGVFCGKPSMSPFLAIRFSPVIETLPKR